MSRFLLVELRWDVSPAERDGAFGRLAADPDVLAVTDTDCISRDTLDLLLLPPDQSYKTISHKKARRTA